LKRKITYGLLTILLIGGLYFVLRFAFGLFTPFNFWTAGQDIKNKKIQIAEIGEMPLNFEQKQKLANSYGFNFYLFGCNVSKDIINGTEYYNNKIIDHLESKFGACWWTKFQNKLDSIDNSVLKTADDKIKLHKLKKLFVVGDFDGDEKKDTIFQHNYSKLSKTEIDNSADPFQNEWNTVVNWFYYQNADLYLTLNKNNQDTLHFGTAQGLYCLINIGDNNADGKDEIALVIDYLDFSRVNSCKIYSLCKDKWKLLKQFGVHEDAFNFTTNKAPLFDNIKDYLEKQNDKWVYKDYSQVGYDKQENVGKMLSLKLNRCK